jgi:SPP1 gp7 family putative phage head morphogenesis protein
MSDIDTLARQFRAELIAGNREAIARLVLSFSEVNRRSDDRLARLLKQMAEAETVSQSWLFEESRLRTLRAQVEEEINRFAGFAERVINSEQARAVALVGQQAAEIGLINTSFTRLPREALIDLIGNLSDGSPLRTIFAGFGKEAADAIQRELISGIALGRGPRQVARAIRPHLGHSLTRAMTIARTETMRVYRSSSIRTYRENADLLSGWKWQASLSGRTCAACIAMHGTIHPVTEDFASHPNCRCATVPILMDAPRTYEFGEDWFDRQPLEVKEKVLGSKAALLAYQAKQVTLPDFVGSSTSAKWGAGRYQRSLKEILGTEKARDFYPSR